MPATGWRHLHAAKELIPLSVEKLGSRIFYIHASDNDGRDNYHWAPGKGTVDWTACSKLSGSTASEVPLRWTWEGQTSPRGSTRRW